MSDGENLQGDRVFVVSISDTEIVFCPRAYRIVSRFKSESGDPARQDQGTSAPKPEST